MDKSKLQTLIILAFCITAFGADTKSSKINAQKSLDLEPVPEQISLSTTGLSSADIFADSDSDTDTTTKNYLVEVFESSEDAFDLTYHSVTFVPTQDGMSYTVEVQLIPQLPNDPTKGINLGLGDDTFSFVKLGDTESVSIYGVSFNGFYVGSNGYITFTEGDQDYMESLESQFDTLRISGLFHDFNPAAGGQVNWQQLPDRVVVNWLNVPEYGTNNSSTFQIALFFDGSIQVSWASVEDMWGIVGLSDGLGVPPDFQETDFSELSEPPVPPIQDDYLTEQFTRDENPFDLEYKSVMFFPTADGSSYGGYLQDISDLPTYPFGGTNIKLLDDNFVWVRLAGQSRVRIFNQSFSSFFVGSNGYITFTQPDNTFIETLADHFDTLRISGLFTDLTLAYTGVATAKQLFDRVAISWLGVPEFENTALNTFQIEMFYDGRIRISWLDIGSRSNIVGLSNGLGLPQDFVQTDFSVEYAPKP